VCYHKIESIITEMVERSIETLIARKVNVIYDATNLKASYLKSICDLVKYMADIQYQIFDIDLPAALMRDSNRERSVGSEVIERMYTQYRTLLDSYAFEFTKKQAKKYIPPQFDCDKPSAIIFDIDGTLAHISGKRSPYDYTGVQTDDVDVTVRYIAQLCAQDVDKIIILSGREDSCRSDTFNWLTENKIHFDELLMRQTGDSRKDSIIKEEIFWKDIEPNYNVIAVFDDRDQVVKMWRSLGIKCFQCDYGNF